MAEDGCPTVCHTPHAGYFQEVNATLDIRMFYNLIRIFSDIE